MSSQDENSNPPEPARKFRYKEAFVMSPKLKLRIVEIKRISDGIAILEALGEGKILVSTRKRPKEKGYLQMAECSLEELRDKTPAEILTILDRRTAAIEERMKRPRLLRHLKKRTK